LLCPYIDADTYSFGWYAIHPHSLLISFERLCGGERRNKIVVRLLRRCHSIFDWKSEKNRDIAGAPMAWQWDSLGV